MFRRTSLPWRKPQLNLFLTDLLLEWKENFGEEINEHSFKFRWLMYSSSHNYQMCLLLENRECNNPLFMENWHMQCIAHDIIYRVFCGVLVIITELFIIDLIWNVNEFKSSLLKCRNNHKKIYCFLAILYSMKPMEMFPLMSRNTRSIWMWLHGCFYACCITLTPWSL